MRPKGLSWIALTGLMVLGAPAAEAGVSCKIVPSWCPAGDGAGAIRNGDTRNGNAHSGVTASNKGVGAASTSTGTSNVATSAAGVTSSVTGVAANTAGVTTGAAGVAASTPGVTSSPTDVAAAAASITTSSGAAAGKTTSVPEPASLFLLGAGVSAVGAAMRRRRKSP
jgi:hypothetical protein